MHRARRLRTRMALSTLLSTLMVLAVTAALPRADVGHGGRGIAGAKAAPAEVDDILGPEEGYLFSRSVLATPNAQSFALVGRQRAGVAAATKREAPQLLTPSWRFEGPTDIGGRVTDLALEPGRSGSVFVATAGGGVWHTTDGGKTFRPAWPRRLPQAVGSIAMSKDGTLYAGTGETNPGGGSITYGGDGMYRSSNDGRTWKHVGLGGSSAIARIVIDPLNPRRVYAAVSGNLYIPGGKRGLYVSNDRGDTWQRVLKPPNATTGACDIAIDPMNPNRIFVGMWDHIRKPSARTYTGVGSGLWLTTNRGQSWTHLGPANGLLPDSNINGRIGVAVDPTNPKNVYMIYANDPFGAFEAFYTSMDGGQTWVAPPNAQGNLAASQSVYGWWFAHIWVDPWNPTHVFIAGLELYESTTSGQTFVPDVDVHADQHAMAFDPKVKGLVYLGNDGGFYRSSQAGTPGSYVKATYEPWTQFDGLDVSEQDPSRISGGLQDNGSVRSWSDPSKGTAGWDSYYGGDGQQNLINPKNKDNIFACYQYGSCAVSTDGGKTMNEFDQGTVSDRHNYFTPMAFDPQNPSTVYYAGDYVNKSVDGGQTWVPVSTDLGDTDPGFELNPLYAAHYGTVTTLAVSAKNGNLIWAGTDNGLLWKTTTGGPVWTKVTAPNLPNRWVSHVAIDPADDDTVYVTYSGFREGVHTAYVYRTRDGGSHWTNISANLPQAPVNDLAVIGHSLYAATDVGVFTAQAQHVRWHVIGRGLPNAAVTHLRYVATNGRLYVSTFGRCVWSLQIG
jgi:photosystem II stability/assembly factor-like uncharacterized protein